MSTIWRYLTDCVSGAGRASAPALATHRTYLFRGALRSGPPPANAGYAERNRGRPAPLQDLPPGGPNASRRPHGTSSSNLARSTGLVPDETLRPAARRCTPKAVAQPLGNLPRGPTASTKRNRERRLPSGLFNRGVGGSRTRISLVGIRITLTNEPRVAAVSDASAPFVC